MIYHFAEGTKLSAGSIPPKGSTKSTKTEREGGHDWSSFRSLSVYVFELKEMALSHLSGQPSQSQKSRAEWESQGQQG